MQQLILGKDGYKVTVLKSKYPQGAEKVLIYETTGKVVKEPASGRSGRYCYERIYGGVYRLLHENRHALDPETGNSRRFRSGKTAERNGSHWRKI